MKIRLAMVWELVLAARSALTREQSKKKHQSVAHSAHASLETYPILTFGVGLSVGLDVGDVVVGEMAVGWFVGSFVGSLVGLGVDGRTHTV